MRKAAIFSVWGRILRGYCPFLSIEITKKCPLRCSGCYAREPEHLNNGDAAGDVEELQGAELVEKVLGLVRRCRPVHVSIVGGEPLVRHRELTVLIPSLIRMGIEVQIITSAVAPIPAEWAGLHLAVSVDGLQPEHDSRRAPATYDRILRHIQGHQIIIHCTVIPQFLEQPGYLKEFAHIWSCRPEVRKIWFSLFTPQQGLHPPERLTAAERKTAIDRIAELLPIYPKVDVPELVLRSYRNPPRSPCECIFAQATTCVAADLTTPVLPCQIGGRPECRECGCIAAAGLAAIGDVRLAGILRLSDIFGLSRKFGDWFRRSNRFAPSCH